MYNLMKYEIKSRYKSLCWLIGIFIVFNVFTMLKIAMDGGMLESLNGITYSLKESSSSHVNFMLLMIAGFYGGLVPLLIAIWGLQSMAKDLHQPTGYLILSIPQRGYSIVGAKLLAALVEFTIGLLLIVAFVILHVVNIARLGSLDLYVRMTEYNEVVVKLSIFIILGLIYLFMYVMVAGYFSTVFIRSFFAGRKFGNLAAFVTFVVVLYLMSQVIQAVELMFPASIDISFWIFDKIPTRVPSTSFNIAGTITEIAILFGLFWGTGWLLENQVEV